jgi:hypothetical protein
MGWQTVEDETLRICERGRDVAERVRGYRGLAPTAVGRAWIVQYRCSIRSSSSQIYMSVGGLRHTLALPLLSAGRVGRGPWR